MLLKFYISETPLIEFDLDHKTRKANIINFTDTRAIAPIFSKRQLSYDGLEQRLQEMTDTNKSLEELTADIAEHGLCCPFHINLKAKVD